MSKHSPVPWVIGKSPTGETTDSLAILDARGDPVYDLGDWPTLQERANARLMAAAPRMLALLEELEYWSDMAGEFDADGMRRELLAVLAEVRH